MKKKLLLVVLIILVIIVIALICVCIKRGNEAGIEVEESIIDKVKIVDDLPEEYLVRFHDNGSPEVGLTIYVYQVGNHYEYVIESWHTEHWGSPNTISDISKKGKTDNLSEIFKIVEENHANGFAIVYNDNKPHAYEDYKKEMLENN